MIYFIRHGQTDYNVQGRAQGVLDIPLNATGVKQALEAKEQLKDYKIDFIFSSPLIRARKTAEIINEYHNKEIICDDRLKEYNFGCYQGEVVRGKENEIINMVLKNPEQYGAEPYDAYKKRVTTFFNEVNNLGKNVLVVSHGGVYRMLCVYLSEITGEKIEINPAKNCEVITIDINNKK